MNTNEKQPRYSEESRDRAVRLVEGNRSKAVRKGGDPIDIVEVGLYAGDAAPLGAPG